LGVGSLLAALIASAACGKKGPPLAPIVHVPAAVETIAAQRRGDEVVVTMTVPSKNIDGTMPVDIGRIDVFGYTGTSAPPRGRFLEVATLVGAVTVAQPKTEAGSPAPDPATSSDPLPGTAATFRETLTPETLVAKPIPPAPVTGKREPLPLPTAVAAPEGPLRRFYLALPVSPRGRIGPPGPVAEVRLTPLPEAPATVTRTLVADAVRLDWEPSGGLLGFLLDRSLAPEISPLDEPADADPAPAAVLDGPTRYNVYREIASPPQTDVPPKAAAPVAAVPVLLNPTPLDVLTFSDPVTALDGRERCYVVRSVRGQGAQAVEGNPSERVCIEPVDNAAPEPPAGLQAVVSEGSIALIWVPNAEADVAGYLVLRGEAGDATLTPVTDAVVTEARYTDRTVKPGVRYVYAVQAIDTRLPRPNVSAESMRVEGIAR
jgi:hypothetical protein